MYSASVKENPGVCRQRTALHAASLSLQRREGPSQDLGKGVQDLVPYHLRSPEGVRRKVQHKIHSEIK